MAISHHRGYSCSMEPAQINHELGHNGITDGWKPVFTRGEQTLTKSRARALALVLDSRSIPCCIHSADAAWLLLVPEQQLESARRELRLFEEANHDWPPPQPSPSTLVGSSLPTVSALLLLAILHNLTFIEISLPGRGIIDLHELGVAHSASIKSGEWWRLVTALTIHSGSLHLIGNMTLGGTFILLLSRELGSGVAWSLLLASGVSGNLINAWAQAPDHRSLGASTAVFGAVGILAALRLAQGRRHLRRRWFVPLAAGLALLAVLGTEGKNTDLGAHLFGFGSGFILGFPAGKYGRAGGAMNAWLALFSAALVLAAWWSALTFG